LPYTVCLSPTEDRSALLVDMYVADDTLIIEGSVPGVRRADVTIDIHGAIIAIHAASHTSARRGCYVRRERYAGGWSRTIELPTPVEPSTLTWNVTRGVLTLRICKPAVSTPATPPAAVAPSAG
jgi:HSP20 family protein